MSEEAKDLFRYERRVLTKAQQTIEAEEYEDNPLLGEFESLVKKYKRLLKQSEKILKISDNNQMLLRETQNNLETLLNHADQGFLTFGADFIIDDEYSQECERIFGFDIGGENSLELIFAGQDLEEEIFANIFEVETEEVGLYFDLLPENLELNNKFIEIEYKLIENEERKIMCILTDISEKIELENKLERERNNLKMIINAVINQNLIRKYIKDYRNYFTDQVYQRLATEDSSRLVSELYREVHTFKGLFSQWNMDQTAQQLHEVEDRLSRLKEESDLRRDDLLEFVVNTDFNGFLEADIEIIEATLGSGFLEDGEVLLIKKEKILELEDRAESYLEPEAAEEFIAELKKLRCEPVREMLTVHEDYLRDLAQREGKEINSFTVEGGADLFVDEAAYYDFNKSLIHIFRNMISHGIEMPEDREMAGKTAGGNIVCRIEKVADQLRLRLKDDGQGIDIESLKETAVSRGVKTEATIDSLSRDEAIRLIFSDSLSTKEEADELTGRGMGLAAVKQEVEELGGQILVETELNQGTEFEILLPLIKN